MTTYFHGNSEIQGGGGGGDGLQTLILMNPSYIGYTDNQQPQPQPQPQRPQTNNNNLIFFNNSTATGNTLNLPHHHHPSSTQTQPFLGTPIQSNDISSFHHGLLPRIHHYNMYNSQIDHIGEAREVTRAQQGLSLSLSSQNPPPGYGSVRVDDVKVSGGSPSSASGVSNGVNHGLILSSKYIKAAQELLEEFVNVGNGGKIVAELSKNIGESSAAAAAAASGDGQSGGEDCSVKRGGAELTTAERQEIQMKKAKLVNMLDEVDQRYKQYHQQMQIVISWFEQATGIGSAKTYTALALQTISKQFRCLKDAILGQIRATSKSLGEENSLGTGKIEGSRLKYVDNQIRQQNALQQLGMIQHNNAWRPQRGLPERSVSVLRAWLFEHFLHPYPKDSDKIMLAKQTGLTRSQVSNWFINARVRLWKPMVEEMYTEEMKENEKNGSEDKTEQNQDSTSKSPKQDNPIINQTTPPPTSMAINSGFNLIGPSEIETTTQQSPKKHRFNISSIETDSTDQMSMKFEIERQSRPDGFTFMAAPTNFIGGFGSYPIGELGRFGPDQFQSPYSNNGVSLTLGLPHCENISMTGAHQTFEIGESNDFHTMNNNNQTSNVYENINIQNRKRFAAQLLPDFVT
ncbi:hypothetical protein RD792_011728 [Penstemon davidsonii]|uniref:Homeobox domain-containing protein n=1 Tax=Penstemon davidsonii TaxID=160366 RepID=A0ABR0CWL1_9LAMI|nr:hypothetical protein RD792_011728 [Penstemon davidsonii]